MICIYDACMCMHVCMYVWMVLSFGKAFGNPFFCELQKIFKQFLVENWIQIIKITIASYKNYEHNFLYSCGFYQSLSNLWFCIYTYGLHKVIIQLISIYMNIMYICVFVYYNYVWYCLYANLQRKDWLSF